MATKSLPFKRIVVGWIAAVSSVNGNGNGNRNSNINSGSAARVVMQQALSRWWESAGDEPAAAHTYVEGCSLNGSEACNPTCPQSTTTSGASLLSSLDVVTTPTSAAPGLDVAVHANGSYVVSVDGHPWFVGDDTFITSGAGTVYSLADGSLALEKTVTSTGFDGLGAFAKTTMVLRATTTPPQTVEFSIKAWNDGETLEFVQAFPHGLADTASAEAAGKNGVSSSFPSWRPASLPRGAESGTGSGAGSGRQRGWMAYDGWDCASDGGSEGCIFQEVAPAGHVAYGPWDNDTSELPGGLEGSGPMAIFAADKSRTVVVSAFTNTMAQSQVFVSDVSDLSGVDSPGKGKGTGKGKGPGVLRYGLLGSVTEIPAGWSSSVILSLGRAPGAAVRTWGSKLLSFYGKEPALSRADFISTHLG